MKSTILFLLSVLCAYCSIVSADEYVARRCVPLQLSDLENRSELLAQKRRDLVDRLCMTEKNAKRFFWLEGKSDPQNPMFMMIGYSVDTQGSPVLVKFTWGWVDAKDGVAYAWNGKLRQDSLKDIVRAAEDAADKASPLTQIEREQMDTIAGSVGFGVYAYSPPAIFEVAGRPEGNLAFTHAAYAPLGCDFRMEGSVLTLQKAVGALARVVLIARMTLQLHPEIKKDNNLGEKVMGEIMEANGSVFEKFILEVSLDKK